MAYIKEELEGIFFIENVFIYDTITKTVEYNEDEDEAEEKAQQMLNEWKEECFVFEYYFNCKKNLFSGRVFIETQNNRSEIYIRVDGILLKKIDSSFNSNALFSYREIVYFFNDIAVYGVDSFLEKYIANFMENYPLIEQEIENSIQHYYKLINETSDDKKKTAYIENIETLKKKFWSYLSTRYYLGMWRPIGKTNEEMMQAVSKLKENLVWGESF